jgi:sugar phosphate isomerase/epimerase
MSHFTLSCTTCALRGWGHDETLDTFQHAPAAGYRYWGTAAPVLRTGESAEWADIERMKRLATAAGLLGCTEVYANGIPTRSLAAAVAHAPSLAGVARAAVQLGSPLLVFSGSYPREEGHLAATIAGIQALLPLIHDLPIRIALEPHIDSTVQFAEDYEAFLAAIPDPQFGITVDVGHFHTAGVDWARLIQRYPERVYNVHLKDQLGPQSVPIGAGEIDLTRLIEVLHAVDYCGALAVELEVVDPENLPAYCAQAHKVLRQLVHQVVGEYPD